MMPESIQSPSDGNDAEEIIRELERKEAEFKEMERKHLARKEALRKQIEARNAGNDVPSVPEPLTGEVEIELPDENDSHEESSGTDTAPESPPLEIPLPEMPVDDTPSEKRPMDEEPEKDLEQLTHLKEEAERKIRELEQKKKDKKLKREEELRESYRREIVEFEARGYDTGRLLPFFVGDLGALRTEVMTFMADIRSLKELEARLDKLDIHGFEDYVTRLLPLLHNPDKVHECRRLVDDLEENLKEHQKKILEKKKSRIAELRDMLDHIEENAKRSVHKKKIEDIKQLIFKQDTTLSDLDFLQGEIERLGKSLEEKEEDEEERHKASLKREIEHYKKKGFRTGPIENTVRRAPIEEAREEYMMFLTAVNSLETLKKELDEMETDGFESDVRRISFTLNDPAKVDEAKSDLSRFRHRLQKKRIAGLSLPKNPTFKCKKCGELVPITSEERPLRLNCPVCGKVYNLKKRAEKKEVPPAGNAPGEGPAVVFTQIEQPESAPAATGDTVDLSQLNNFCPFCGAELLPDSTFCGMCGNTIE